jgi:hypothetical protein
MRGNSINSFAAKVSQFSMIINSAEYERIYKIINSMVLNERVTPEVSCILFSFFGAQILKNHYNLSALPKAGVAAYQLGSDESAKIIADEGASFHCWIEVNGWLIDFMAPSFSNLKAAKDAIRKGGLKVSSKMMQKPLTSMSGSIAELKQAGDFYLEANNEVLAIKYRVIKNTPVFGDLADVCSQWYTKPPKGIISSMVIEDQEGELTTIPLQGERVIGVW